MTKRPVKSIKQLLSQAYSAYMMKGEFYDLSKMQIGNTKRINWSGYDL